jgi:hypothetical protein
LFGDIEVLIGLPDIKLNGSFFVVKLSLTLCNGCIRLSDIGVVAPA